RRAGPFVEPIRHDPNPGFDAHLAEARKVLALPIEVSGLHWHPFGVYAIPLAKRTDASGSVWSRRLHLWHPAGEPVGPASPYGVHTHSGTARSHVLAGRLTHHLYAFEADPEGLWQRACLGKPEGRATLLAHLQEDTTSGTTHTLPKDQPHGVTKPDDAFAVSLFEQRGGEKAQEFTTWQRTDVPAQPPVRRGPVPLARVQAEGLAVLDQVADEMASVAPG
ncbi:MAG: hypothetical protein ACPGQL_04645, partial [Thermoplasmatota archaeon]